MVDRGSGDGEGDSRPDRGADGGGDRLQWRTVGGPLGEAAPPPLVRLVREYKGLTVADMMRDEIAERLPSQARAALQHIERGDLAAAERALPGEFGAVLPGPGARPQWRQWLLLWGLVTIALVAGALATGWF